MQIPLVMSNKSITFAFEIKNNIKVDLHIRDKFEIDLDNFEKEIELQRIKAMYGLQK